MLKEPEVKETAIEVRTNSPAEMIRAAVEKGASLTDLSALLDLQMKWEANEAKKAFQKAMSEFKKNPPSIDKDRKVAFGNTRYSHASLYNVVEKITSELSKHGLSASWVTHQNGQIDVTCRITHVQGYSEETTIQAPADTSGSKNAIQAIGSTISYLQRYSLLSVLGLAAHDADDDGASVSDSPLSDEQIATLRDHILATGADEAMFLKFLKADSLAKVMQSQFPKALNALKLKASKAKAVKK